MASTKGLPEYACKNSPRKSVYCGDEHKPDQAQILRELNHAKVMFQRRALCAVLGLPAKDES